MKLLIPKNISTDQEFVKFIIQIIKNVFQIKFSNKKATAFDKKIEKLGMYKNKFDTKVILANGINHLTYKKDIDGFRIYIKERIPIVRYDSTLDKLCRFITYGNSEIQGYGIINDVFKEVYKDIDKYKSIYENLY